MIQKAAHENANIIFGAVQDDQMKDTVKITVIGRGNVGGGLAKLWREAGHQVQELGRDGGDGGSTCEGRQASTNGRL